MDETVLLLLGAAAFTSAATAMGSATATGSTATTGSAACADAPGSAGTRSACADTSATAGCSLSSTTCADTLSSTTCANTFASAGCAFSSTACADAFASTGCAFSSTACADAFASAGCALSSTALKSLLDRGRRWPAASSATPANTCAACCAGPARVPYVSSGGRLMEALGTHRVSVDIDVPPVDIDIPVDIYIYIMAAPTPRAPTPAPGRSYGNSPKEPKPYANSNPGENRGIDQGGIRGVPPWSVDHCRVVTGNIDNFWIDRLDLDIVTLDNHLLLRGRLEIAGGLGLLPQFLNRIHHIGLLSQESFTHLLRPGRLFSHHGEDLRKRRQRLHAQVPVHRVQGVIERVPFKARVFLQPAVRFHHLIRISCCYEHLCQQRIRIERNRRQHLVQLLRAECRGRSGTLTEGSIGDHHHNEDPDQSADQEHFSFHNSLLLVVRVKSFRYHRAKSTLIGVLSERTDEASN